MGREEIFRFRKTVVIYIQVYIEGQYGQTGHHATLLHLASLHDLFGQLDTYIQKSSETTAKIQSKARESQSGSLLRDTLPRSQIFHSHPVVPGLGGTSPHHG